jgi:threonine/homoserine/homoserine lactone efflux protein
LESILNEILTPIILGLIGGVTPGPIILLAFSEILKDSKKGLANGGIYLIYAGLTELFIGLFLIITSKSFQVPAIVFHLLSIIGIALLIYIAIKIFNIRSIKYDNKTTSIKPIHIIGLMILNGPLWIFWISVCLPSAFKLGQLVNHGEYIFLLVFEFSMMTGLGIMLVGFNTFRDYFSNYKIVRITFRILTIILGLLIIKMIYTESFFFYSLIKDIF